MKSKIRNSFPPLFDVDSYVEFHAARILLLLYRCNGIIDGRTKLAKLDFFVRYPMAVKRVLDAGLVTVVNEKQKLSFSVDPNSIESQMIRYRYGPWDPKYAVVIPYLQSLGLLTVDSGKSETYTLTERGESAARDLLQDKSFQQLDATLQVVSQVFSTWKGSQLKRFIYDNFEEITALNLGETIVQ